MRAAPLMLLCLLCQACDGGTEADAGKDASPARVESHASAPATENAPPDRGPVISRSAHADATDRLSPQERARANALLDFHNLATGALGSGYYAMPDAMMRQVADYLETWELAPRPTVRGTLAEARRALQPPDGLFSAEEAVALTAALERMDKALDSMRHDYRALERYVRDDSIRDDGVKGKALAASLAGDHADFLAARHAWLAVVSARAREAEDALLTEHPLQRQIGCAEQVFTLFARAAGLLSAEKPDRAALAGLARQLEAALAEAGAPPFAAPPATERLYRAFLTLAAGFPRELSRGLSEGFYSPRKRELNRIMRQSREAYNAFAAEAGRG